MIAHIGKRQNRRTRQRPEDNPARIELKEWMRAHRRALGLDPIDMAASLGMLSYNSYIDAERGVNRFVPSHWDELARALEVDTGFLARRLLKAYHPDLFEACFKAEVLASERMPRRKANRSFAEPSPEDLAHLRRRISKRLLELRKGTGKSQRKIAAVIGFANDRSISAYERGATTVPPERYVAYADALGQDRCAFIKEMTAHYEPIMHHYLFGTGPGRRRQK